MNFPQESHTMENVNGELTVFGGSNNNYYNDPNNIIEKFIGITWQLEKMKYFFSEHASALLPCEQSNSINMVMFVKTNFKG